MSSAWITCPKCGTTDPNDFTPGVRFRALNRGNDGRLHSRPCCKACRKAYAAETRRNNPQAARAKARATYHNRLEHNRQEARRKYWANRDLIRKRANARRFMSRDWDCRADVHLDIGAAGSRPQPIPEHRQTPWPQNLDRWARVFAARLNQQEHGGTS